MARSLVASLMCVLMSTLPAAAAEPEPTVQACAVGATKVCADVGSRWKPGEPNPAETLDQHCSVERPDCARRKLIMAAGRALQIYEDFISATNDERTKALREADWRTGRGMAELNAWNARNAEYERFGKLSIAILEWDTSLTNLEARARGRATPARRAVAESVSAMQAVAARHAHPVSKAVFVRWEDATVSADLTSAASEMLSSAEKAAPLLQALIEEEKRPK